MCEKLADYLEDKGTDGACSAIGCSVPPLSTVANRLGSPACATLLTVLWLLRTGLRLSCRQAG